VLALDSVAHAATIASAHGFFTRALVLRGCAGSARDAGGLQALRCVPSEPIQQPEEVVPGIVFTGPLDVGSLESKPWPQTEAS
jgi:hypothetical protein